MTDAETPADAYRLLEDAEPQPSVYLVRPGNEDLLYQHIRSQDQQSGQREQGDPALLATVTVDQQPVLLIYGALPRPQAAQAATAEVVEVIDARTANVKFDEQFGSWRAMFSIGTRQ
ncbi:MAG: hypothetical protein HC884_17385 [Chloroflexaceae bacterium]|nr:hypothetical protein [Chloroflexaceae bacterium]